MLKRSRYSDEKIAYALKQAEGGAPVADVYPQMSVIEANFYVGKNKYAHLGTSEIRKLRQLREEKAKLKRFAADLSLDKRIPYRDDPKEDSGRHASASWWTGRARATGRVCRRHVA